MTSGVPQGSVLASFSSYAIWTIYQTKFPQLYDSADDCLLYRNINTTHDAETLQEDIDKLQKWDVDWMMELNPDKCEVILITNRRKKKISPITPHTNTN